MTEPAPPPPAPEEKPTLRQEFILIAVIGAMFSLSIALEPVLFPELRMTPDRTTPLEIVGAIAVAVGQAVWITMDRKRRDREVGAWRWFALLVGPIALCVYLIVEYRGRALYLVPLCLGVYVFATALGIAGAVLLGGSTIGG